MALRYYIPYFLEREKANFRRAKGNYLIDFRDKGDSITDADLICEGIPFRLLESLENLNLNVIPFEVNSSEPHISGDNSFYRYFTCDLLAFSDSTSNVSTLYVKPVESFTYRNKSFEFISEDNILTIQATFDLYSYNGKNPEKTLNTLFRSSPILEYSLFVDEKSSTRLDALNSSDIFTITTSNSIGTTEKKVFEDLPMDTSNVKLSMLEQLSCRLNREIFYLPLTATEEEKQNYLTTLENNYFKDSNLYLRESFEDVSISITPISKVELNNESYTFPTGVTSPLSDVYTNYMSYLFLGTSNEADRNRSTIALTSSLDVNTGIYYTISCKTVSPVSTKFMDNTLIPQYNLYSNLDNILPLPFTTIQNGIKITNFDINTYQTFTIINLEDGEETSLRVNLTTEQEINKQIAKLNLASVVLGLDLYIFSIDDLTYLKISKETNSSSIINLSNSMTTEYGNNITVNNTWTFLNAVSRDHSIEVLLDPLQNIESRVLKNIEIQNRDKVTVVVNNTEFESSTLSFIESTPEINKIRHFVDQLNTQISPLDLNLIVTPPNILRLYNNSTEQSNFIGFKNNFINTIEKSENRFESQVDDIYSVVLNKTENPSYPVAEDFLIGSPIILKIFNLSALNQHYLKIDIKDSNAVIDSVRDNTETNINVLVDKLNKVLRKYGVLTAKYDEDNILIFKTNGSSVLLDIYLYDNATITSQPPVISHLNINTSILPFNSTTFPSVVVDFPLNLDKNTSFDYFYFEDNNRQPILLRETLEDILETSFYFQVNPTASSTSIRMKLESNLTSLAFNIITVSLPAFALYTSNIQDYYNQLKTNLEVAITSVLGSSGTLKVRVEQGDFQAPSPATVSNFSIVITSTDTQLRQIKMVVSNSAYIYNVSRSPNIALGYEHYSAVPELFSEFTGTPFTEGISFWLNGV